MTRLFMKRPVVIEAYRYTGASSEATKIRSWMNGGESPVEGGLTTNDIKSMTIPTLEGDMIAQPGDWIIQGIQGEFYPCKPDIFEVTYEEVER